MSTYLSEEQKQTVYAYFGPYFPKDCVMTVSPVHGDADYDWLTIDCGRQGIYDMHIRKEAASWDRVMIHNGLTRREAVSKVVQAANRGQIYEWPNRADLLPSRAALHASRQGKG